MWLDANPELASAVLTEEEAKALADVPPPVPEGEDARILQRFHGTVVIIQRPGFTFSVMVRSTAAAAA
jgi:hypothetical protein